MPREMEFYNEEQTRRCRALIIAVVMNAVRDHFAVLARRHLSAEEDVRLDGLDPDEGEGLARMLSRSRAAMEAGCIRLVELREEFSALLDELDAAVAAEERAKAEVERTGAELTAYDGSSDKRMKELLAARKKAGSELRTLQVNRKPLELRVKAVGGALRTHESVYGPTEWLQSDRGGSFSFLWCCEVVNVSHHKFRALMFDAGVMTKASSWAAEDQKKWAALVAACQ